jgi:hypothetical protein
VAAGKLCHGRIGKDAAVRVERQARQTLLTSGEFHCNAKPDSSSFNEREAD